MHIVPQRMTNYHFTWHITRNSRFQRIINERLLQLSENGLVDYILKYETENIESIPIDKDEENEGKEDETVEPLTLKMLLLLFGSYGTGIILSSVTFCWELAI